ncbi:hypothetical protein [Caldisalinibacter kiritimatiensis]|uniref:Uncharacterized protein n=1 Tax=Caldisalinibacter kiritimatiensis TaxID=1304284 RepID=R1CDV4_9FIRM|nr:hypothetical protein [Caldisalinibacter kiritimatiensis]EOD00460.1 hypothetical protein L21TH_1490 [Caldisalinibacter kiritimatiensis]
MSKKQRNIICMIDGFLVFGLLCYAVIFFLANKNLNPIEISMSESLIERRLFFRRLAEMIYSVCSVIYILGQILLIYFGMKNGYRVSLKRIFIYFFSQIVLALVCVLPFAFFDFSYFSDYIFPLRSLVIILFVMTIGSCIIHYVKKTTAP